MKSKKSNKKSRRKSYNKTHTRSHNKNNGSKYKKKKTKGGNTIRFVEQRKPYDCVLACLSMITGTPYDILKNKYFKDHNFDKVGVKNSKEEEIMKLEGYNIVHHDKLPKGKAIITVKSLNYPKSYHDIFWTGKEIFDPNIGNKRKNKKIKLYDTNDILSGKTQIVDILGIR